MEDAEQCGLTRVVAGPHPPTPPLLRHLCVARITLWPSALPPAKSKANKSDKKLLNTSRTNRPLSGSSRLPVCGQKRRVPLRAPCAGLPPFSPSNAELLPTSQYLTPPHGHPTRCIPALPTTLAVKSDCAYVPPPSAHAPSPTPSPSLHSGGIDSLKRGDACPAVTLHTPPGDLG
jgi:hypothetical protein